MFPVSLYLGSGVLIIGHFYSTLGHSPVKQPTDNLSITISRLGCQTSAPHMIAHKLGNIGCGDIFKIIDFYNLNPTFSLGE